MKRTTLAPLLAVVVTSAACGSFREAAEDPVPGADDAATEADAAVDAGSETATAEDVIVVTSAGPPAAKPVACPYTRCNGANDCKDDDCDNADRDFTPTGEITVANGECHVATVGAANVTFHTYPRATARTHAVLALELRELTGDRAIAKLSIEGAPDGERIVVRRRNGLFELCELDGSGTARCTPPLSVTLPQTMHLFGIVTSDDPPTATFALATNANNCDAQRLLDVTKPFPAGDIRAEVGCVENGGSCSVRYDNAIFIVRPE